MSPEQEAVQRSRVTYHERRIALLERCRELGRCSACRSVPQACTQHTHRVVRELLAEAAALLSA